MDIVDGSRWLRGVSVGEVARQPTDEGWYAQTSLTFAQRVAAFA